MSIQGETLIEHHEGMLPVVESVDVAQRDDVHKLKPGAVGLAGVLFLTVTGSAPISAMLFNTPIAVGFGNGIGAPAGFLFATVVLVIFSVGYVAMSRKVTTAGGFYSFISHGLGRELGMASGFAMVAAYSVFEVSLVGGFAYFAQIKAASYGWHVQWYWFGFFMIALIAVLAFFDVQALLSDPRRRVDLRGDRADHLRRRHLHRRQQQRVVRAINPINAFKSLPAGHFGGTALAAGAAGIGIFFAFWSWVGFEMAPNYGEESKNPKKNVPRALYISVIGLGIFYTLTSWAGISGYSHFSQSVNVAQNNSANFYFLPALHYSGAVPQGRAQLADHHRLVRLRHGVPQHDRAGTCTRSAASACCPRRWAGPTRFTRARTSPRPRSR